MLVKGRSDFYSKHPHEPGTVYFEQTDLDETSSEQHLAYYDLIKRADILHATFPKAISRKIFHSHFIERYS